MNKKFKFVFLSLLAILFIGVATACDKNNSSSSGTEETVTTYTVTYNSNGGTTVSSQSVKSGAKATKPADPTRAGYSFDGWFSDSALTKAFNFDTAITSNITLYAKWTENITPVTTYTVTFNSNGGSAITTQTIDAGGKVTRPNNPTKTGYTFDAWYKNEALTEAYDFNAAVTANLTLYAKWNINTFSVTFSP